MDAQSLKRLVVTGVSAAVLLVGHKLGLSDTVLGMFTGLVGTFLAQSGANAVFAKVAASKAGADIGKVLGVVAELKAAYDQAQGAVNLGDAQAAAAKPVSASNA